MRNKNPGMRLHSPGRSLKDDLGFFWEEFYHAIPKHLKPITHAQYDRQCGYLARKFSGLVSYEDVIDESGGKFFTTFCRRPLPYKDFYIGNEKADLEIVVELNSCGNEFWNIAAVPALVEHLAHKGKQFAKLGIRIHFVCVDIDSFVLNEPMIKAAQMRQTTLKDTIDLGFRSSLLQAGWSHPMKYRDLVWDGSKAPSGAKAIRAVVRKIENAGREVEFVASAHTIDFSSGAMTAWDGPRNVLRTLFAYVANMARSGFAPVLMGLREMDWFVHLGGNPFLPFKHPTRRMQYEHSESIGEPITASGDSLYGFLSEKYGLLGLLADHPLFMPFEVSAEIEELTIEEARQKGVERATHLRSLIVGAANIAKEERFPTDHPFTSLVLHFAENQQFGWGNQVRTGDLTSNEAIEKYGLCFEASYSLARVASTARRMLLMYSASADAKNAALEIQNATDDYATTASKGADLHHATTAELAAATMGLIGVGVATIALTNGREIGVDWGIPPPIEPVSSSPDR